MKSRILAISTFRSENEAAYDAIRRRVRHRHTLNALAAKKRRKRRWFLAYSLLILSTVAGVIWATSKESSLGAALLEAIGTVYPGEAAAAFERPNASSDSAPLTSDHH